MMAGSSPARRWTDTVRNGTFASARNEPLIKKGVKNYCGWKPSESAHTTTSDGGSRTPSMMWATPLEARLSAPVTFFRSCTLGPTFTSPWYLMTCTGLPSTVFTDWKVFRSVDKTCAGSTWYVRMSTSVALFSGFKRSSNVPAGSAPKASLVGANTVKCPGELRVSTRSPATTAATKVDRSSTDCANSTMLGRSSDKNLGGKRTPSIMCATPLEARLSAAVTLVVKAVAPTRTSSPALSTCKG